MKKVKSGLIYLLAFTMLFGILGEPRSVNALEEFISDNYVEEIETFDLGDGTENIALNKRAVASSNEGTAGRFEVAAIDGDMNSRWASRAGKDDSTSDITHYTVDLGSEYKVNRIKLSWESRPNKYKLQYSTDNETWIDIGDVIDHGFIEEGEDYHKVDEIEFESVIARYIRMQGIQRRRLEDMDENSGYSIYEFEVYGEAWTDEDFIKNYTQYLNLPARVSRDFTVPVSNEDYGVNISWSSDSDQLVFNDNGVVNVDKAETEKEVVIVAKVTRGTEQTTKSFNVVVSSNQVVDYNIYPVPQNIIQKDEVIYIKNKVNILFEEAVNSYTRDNLTDLLDNNQITYEVVNEIDKDKINIIIGIDDGVGKVDEHFKDVEYDKTISSGKAEGYVLDVNADNNVIAILGHENTGASYGITTLSQMISQSEGNIKGVLIEDAPETLFRGFVEGFYGAPWSFENRSSLMEFGGEYKMNTYIYGPKDDPYHASQWRVPYPEKQLNELKNLVEVGKKTNVEFVWAIHVGGRIDLGSEEDIQAVKDKFDQLYDIGVRQFAVFFDDASTDNTELVSFMNEIQRNYVDLKGDMKPLVFCPQYYNKKNTNIDYLTNLRNFDERIEIMWTGDNVLSEVNQDVIDYIVNLIDRPVYVWWNYPVNDLGMSHLLHMGPTESLQPNINNMSGLASNPMNQAQANKVSLFSIADYGWNSTKYDSQKSWEDSWERIITDNDEALEAFKIFVQNNAEAPLIYRATDESVYLIPFFDAFKAKYYSGEDYTNEAQVVADKFDEIIKSIEILRGYKGTNNISAEIEPWMSNMYEIAKTGKFVFTEVQNLAPINKADDDSIIDTLNFISLGREKLIEANQGHSGKKSAQKRLYPFINSVLQDFEDSIYPALDLPVTTKGYGSANVDYSNMIDGVLDTGVNLGSQHSGSFFAVDLGMNQKISTISLNMSKADKDEKPGYYKKGVLEYSINNEDWNVIGEFDTNVIELTELNVNARFIRYRAEEIFEDITTGVNTSNIEVYEFGVNEEKAVVLYTNTDLDDLKVVQSAGKISLITVDDIVLNENEYVGFEFNKAKFLSNIVSKGNDLSIESSFNGIDWEEVSDVAAGLNSKYLRLINKTKNKTSFSIEEFSVKNGGLANVIEANAVGGSLYSGNANDTIDGDKETGIWYAGATGAVIEYKFDMEIPLASMGFFFTTDFLKNAHIDVTNDGVNWRTVATINENSSEYSIPLSGEKATGLKLYIDQGGWVKINEVTLNLSTDMQIIDGEGSGVAYAADKNIFSSYKSSEASHLTYQTVNHTNENVLVIVKNKGTEIMVEGLVDGEWKDYGKFSNVYNEVMFEEKVEEFKISWSDNKDMEIYEITSKHVELSDKEHLENVIKDANQLEADKYTPETWAKFEQVLKDVTKVLENNSATQDEIDAAVEALQKAMDQMELLADLTEIKDLLESVKDLNLNKYEEAVEIELLALISKIELALNDANTTQTEIDSLYKELTEFKENMQEMVLSLTILSGKVKQVERIDFKLYKADGVNNLKEKLKEAKEIEAILNSRTSTDRRITQKDIDESVVNLDLAVQNLELKDAPVVPEDIDLSELIKIFEEIDKLNLNEYTDKSVKRLQSVLTDVSNELENDNLTQADVDRMISRLKEAVEGLEKVDASNEKDVPPTGISSKTTYFTAPNKRGNGWHHLLSKI